MSDRATVWQGEVANFWKAHPPLTLALVWLDEQARYRLQSATDGQIPAAQRRRQFATTHTLELELKRVCGGLASLQTWQAKLRPPATPRLAQLRRAGVVLARELLRETEGLRFADQREMATQVATIKEMSVVLQCLETNEWHLDPTSPTQALSGVRLASAYLRSWTPQTEEAFAVIKELVSADLAAESTSNPEQQVYCGLRR